MSSGPPIPKADQSGAPADESVVLPTLGQEAVIGPALASAAAPDQLALLPPDVSPPTPTAVETAALPGSGDGVPSVSAPSIGDVVVAALPPAEVSAPVDHAPDVTGTFAGPVFVTAAPTDVALHAMVFDGAPVLTLPTIGPSPFPFTPSGPPIPTHAIPEDHTLMPVALAPAAVDPPPQPTAPPPSAAAHPHATASISSGGGDFNFYSFGSDTLVLGAGGVNLSIAAPSPPSPGPGHSLSLAPASGGGYTVDEDGVIMTLAPGETAVTGSGNDRLTVSVGSHGDVTVDAHGALTLSGSVSGNLDVTSTGTITSAGSLSVNGNATFAAGTATTLAGSGGSLTVVATGAITLTNAVAISSLDHGGTLTIEATGAIQTASTATVAGYAYVDHHAVLLPFDPTHPHA